VNWEYVEKQFEAKAKHKTLYQQYLERATDDDKRNNKTFESLYMKNKYAFILTENPKRLHQRLDIQNGVFLCPGTVTKSFMQNLSSFIDDNSKSNILKVTCELSQLLCATD